MTVIMFRRFLRQYLFGELGNYRFGTVLGPSGYQMWDADGLSKIVSALLGVLKFHSLVKGKLTLSFESGMNVNKPGLEKQICILHYIHYDCHSFLQSLISTALKSCIAWHREAEVVGISLAVVGIFLGVVGAGVAEVETYQEAEAEGHGALVKNFRYIMLMDVFLPKIVMNLPFRDGNSPTSIIELNLASASQ